MMNVSIDLDTKSTRAAKSEHVLIHEDGQLRFVWRAFVHVAPVGRIGLSEGGKPVNFDSQDEADAYAKAKAKEWRMSDD